MIIVGADDHPSFQQIAFVDTDTGELQERRREHREDAEKCYRDLAAQELKATLTESVL
jgi:transposase